MCLFLDDDDDDTVTESSNNGNPKLQLRHHHTWLIPRRVLLVILTVAIMMVFLGIVMMAIGGGIGSVGLRAAGGALFGLGIIGLIVCFLVCLYAYFFYGTKDQATQTSEMHLSDEYISESPAYASIGRPSALKSSDSTLKRNGILGPKKVTMAPELGLYGELPGSAGGVRAASDNTIGGMGGQGVQDSNTMGMGQGGGVNTSGSMGMAYGSGVNTSGPVSMVYGSSVSASGPVSMAYISSANTPGSMSIGHGVHPTSHATSMASNSSAVNSSNVYVVDGGNLQRMEGGTLTRGAGGIDGSMVGTGGIRITHLDGNQPFPSPGSSISYGGSTSQYHSVTGGGSSASGSMETYAYPKSMLQAGHGRSASYDTASTASQGSTIRSIPVTHIVSDSQKQHQYQDDAVEYARVNKSAKGVQQAVRVDRPQQGIITSQGQAQFQQRYHEDDFDYDNPVERTPMIPPKQHQNASYHEQQMQYQRQRLHSLPQDIHAPRQINTYSLQRQTAVNPMHFSQQHNYQHHQQQQQQQQPQHHHQYQTLYEQQQQQQREQQYSVSNSTSTRNSYADDIPPPQPLVYPSARRPMTFEQVSSSKMSVYDNVLANNLREDDEEEE